MYARRLSKIAYQTALRHTPHSLKYAAMTAWQRKFPPYHLVRSGDVIVQVGVAGHLCPIGRSQAIIYSRLVGDAGKVFAFEAMPENLDLFRSYIARHGVSNVETKTTGLWSEKGLLQFDAPTSGFGSSRIKKVRPNQPYRYATERELPVDTLDNLLTEQGIRRLDLINITTNGAETEIIEGGMACLLRFRPALCVPARPDNLEFFESCLRPLGYRPEEIDVRLHVFGSPIRIIWAEAPAEEVQTHGVSHISA